MIPYNERRAEIASAFAAYVNEHHHAPSARELAETCGCSRQTVDLVIARMVREGLIETGGTARTRRLTGTAMRLLEEHA